MVELLACAPGYRVYDMRCWLGPRDPVRENEFPAFRVAAIVAGSFGVRTSLGRVTASAGSLLLGNARDCYCCTHDTDRGDRCINFDFEAGFLETVRESLGASRVRERFVHAIVPPSAESVALSAVGDALAARHARAVDADALEEAAYEMAAAALTARQAASPQGGRRMSFEDERRIRAAARYIERHHEGACSLQLLARQAAMSPYHFLRVFRRVVGQTPHRYVLVTRLRHAALRLIRSDARIADVAAAAGFNDLSNFNSTFLRAFGLAPRAYRQQRA